MPTGIEIRKFYGTPLFALANNANVNGGKTLTKLELAIMQKQMKNLGMTFEDFGLLVVPEELEGEKAKETRANVSEVGTELNKAYKKQFGSKNDVAVAQMAEVKADAIIKTALDMFNSEHSDVTFSPKSLGARPQFTQPQYKNNAALYAMDLSDWATSVKDEYINASKLSNEALASMIMENDNDNTAILSAEITAYGATILEQVEQGTAEIIKTVKVSANRIVKTIRDAEGHIVQVVQDNANKVIDVVAEEGRHTRNTVREVGADIINDNREQHAITRDQIAEEGARTRNTVKGEAHRTRMYTKQKAKETQEIDAMNSAIAERLDGLSVTYNIAQRVGDMQKQITTANIPHFKRMELLQAIRNQLSQHNTSSRELDKLQELIDRHIKKYTGTFELRDMPNPPDYPRYREAPDYVYPVYEKDESAQENGVGIAPNNPKNECDKGKETEAKTDEKEKAQKGAECTTPVETPHTDDKKTRTKKKLIKDLNKIINKK